MANLTLSIDEAILRRARIRAIEQGTSLNTVVRDYLESYAGQDIQQDALERTISISSAARAGSHGEGRNWNREEIYEDRVGR